ncbi:hypothetical protein OBBRIDRAFT_101752 [Obba rivulosa]|uniref:Uncharacterized protein n=1 Tax=Obba rivulosa TaxID=1052685 RepID=A0A8E2J6U6_9APHY|nr:hypothetical protein OBBRIDRAFT_101752 [Obba rivulosa]
MPLLAAPHCCAYNTCLSLSSALISISIRYSTQAAARRTRILLCKYADAGKQMRAEGQIETNARSALLVPGSRAVLRLVASCFVCFIVYWCIYVHVFNPLDRT